jgi:hypothetical protein
MASGKYAGVNPHNKTATELNRKKFKLRTSGPSVVQRYNWKLEWVSTGNDKRMPFTSYLKMKTKQWHANKFLKKKSKT